jgi:hypothetical protein
MERQTFTEMHREYLDNLIKNYPMDDYVKNGKERKKQRRKELVEKIAFYTIGTIVVLEFTYFAISIESLVELI